MYSNIKLCWLALVFPLTLEAESLVSAALSQRWIVAEQNAGASWGKAVHLFVKTSTHKEDGKRCPEWRKEKGGVPVKVARGSKSYLFRPGQAQQGRVSLPTHWFSEQQAPTAGSQAGPQRGCLWLLSPGHQDPSPDNFLCPIKGPGTVGHWISRNHWTLSIYQQLSWWTGEQSCVLYESVGNALSCK